MLVDSDKLVQEILMYMWLNFAGKNFTLSNLFLQFSPSSPGAS
ncbi:hypothetical protein WN944_023173 [Citrus x changshan-huyou]|uniref:Uncharacterized protein n=1 Tax=Citrus x changshan-huyou TaxID=2935761 RepID=A0AAP0R3N4_9ROSI